jgi:integrase
MSAEDVRAVVDATYGLDPAAGLALRLAAVAGLRRAELAALRWDDVHGDRLTADSGACIVRGDGEPLVQDGADQTANARVIRLDQHSMHEIARLRVHREQASPYFSSSR